MSLQSMFKRPEKFSTPLAKTPAEKSAQKWDRREGSIVVRDANQRKIIIGLLIVCIVLACGLIVQSLKSTVLPYIVEVDTSTGAVKNVGPLKENTYTPQEAEIKYFLNKFLINTREIPLDPVVYKEHWNSAFSFMTKDAASKMTAEIKNEKLSDKFGHKTVQIQIISCLPMEGSNSYTIRWNEEEFAIGSGNKVITPMTGIFTITMIPAKDEQTMQINPLGIYISDFNWSRDATAAKTKTNGNAK